jgi:hypothetical protein
MSEECVCKNCGNGCKNRREKHGVAGALAARPWIWVVLAYFVFVAALSGMVAIAVKHQQPDVLVQRHER